ncbi:MAG: hypothetical protein ACLFO1_03545 [Spirochaetaceae bacterium]
MTRLTQEVLRYQRTGIGLERVYGEAARLVYDYPRRRFGFSEDDCGEFLIFFHRSLLRLIDRYRNTGRTFEAYLYGTMKWQIRTFAGKKRRNAVRYEVVNHRDLWEEIHPRFYSATVGEGADPADCVYEAEPRLLIPGRFEIDADGRLIDPTMQRRVTILALKACLHIDEALIRAVEHAANHEPGWLQDRMTEARAYMRRRTERLRSLQQRRLRAYYNLRRSHDAARRGPPGPAAAAAVRSVAVWHRRLRLIEDEIGRVPRAPTNGEVAEILGIPKGTVDSSLFYMKRVFAGNVGLGGGRDQRPRDQRPRDQRPRDQRPRDQRPRAQVPGATDLAATDLPATDLPATDLPATDQDKG